MASKPHKRRRVELRRLDPEEPALQQFKALKQIRSLTNEDCRAVVSLLHPEGKGARTGVGGQCQYGQAQECLRAFDLDGISIPYMSLHQLLQAKCDSCPGYRNILRTCVARHGNELRLIAYSDETHGGNVLAAPAARKVALLYLAWFEFPTLHMEAMWLTASIIKSADANSCTGGYARVLTEILERYKEEAQNGMAIQMDEACELIFVKDVILLSDHEGFRSALGCKGAAGLKPCIKCSNVLSNGKGEGIAGHVDICETDITKFQEISLDEVREIANMLESEHVQSKREDLQTLLGWKHSTLKHSVFLSDPLRDWIVSMNNIQYDSMHDYWSNGIVAQELGLWYSHFCWNSNKDIKHIRGYVELGWTAVKHGLACGAGNPAHHFDAKLWKVGQDFRGDASTCLLCLPLCASFSEEVLRGRVDNMDPMLDSLQALREVCLCLQRSKVDHLWARNLSYYQKRHMVAFQKAYGTEYVRPKMHFALHLQEQIMRLRKCVDCFVCERKHRAYKNTCARGLVTKRNTFAKTCLLQLVSMELQMEISADFLKPHLNGKATQTNTLSDIFPNSAEILLASNLDVEGITFGRKQFLLLSSTCAVEVHAAVKEDKNFYLLVEILNADAVDKPKAVGQTYWRRSVGAARSQALLPLKDFFGVAFCPVFARDDGQNVLLLE